MIIKQYINNYDKLQLFYNINNSMYYIKLNDTTIDYDNDSKYMLERFEHMTLKLKIKGENYEAQKNVR